MSNSLFCLASAIFQNLRSVVLEGVNFVTDVFDLVLDDIHGFTELLLIIDVNLYEQIPFFLLGSEMNGLVTGRFMLTADIDSGGNVEDPGVLGVLGRGCGNV